MDFVDWACQKTGAEVWLEQHRCYVRGDMFTMGEYHILRVVNTTFHQPQAPGLLHYSVGNILHYFDKARDGTGTMMLKDVTYHGYNGKPNFASGAYKPPIFEKVNGEAKMTKPERQYVMAAALGHSNLGQERPVRETVQNILSFYPRSLESAVNLLSGQLFEDEEQFEMFLEEAQGWLEKLSVLTEEEIFEQYQWLGPLMREMESAE